jgi:hypothetical protein
MERTPLLATPAITAISAAQVRTASSAISAPATSARTRSRPGSGLNVTLRDSTGSTSTADLGRLATFFHEALDAPCVFPVGEIDWDAVVRERAPRTDRREHVSTRGLYWVPTYYLGSLSDVPEGGRAAEHARRKLTAVLEAVVQQSPLPVDVAITGNLASLGAPGQQPRLRPPDRADAHVIIGMADDCFHALERLHGLPGPKIRLEGHASTAIPRGQVIPIAALRYSRREAPVALARWLAETSEETLATYRRRLDHWLIELSRLLKLAALVERAPDRTLRKAAHRSGISLEQMERILRGWSTLALGELPADALARLFETLAAEDSRRGKVIPLPRLRVEQRMDRTRLNEAAVEKGWDEAKKTLLWETARREFAVAGSDFRYDLLSMDGWVAYDARRLDDR